MNKFEIKSPIFRHSDFKIIGNKINICQKNQLVNLRQESIH